MRTVFAMSAVLALAVSARGDVFSSEFNAHPTEEGWELVAPACGVSAAIENGHYVQRLDPNACSTAPDRAQEIYARTTGDFFGTAGQFLEFRVRSNGRLSGSCIGKPTQVRVNYIPLGGVFRIRVANDGVDFFDYSVAPPPCRFRSRPAVPVPSGWNGNGRWTRPDQSIGFSWMTFNDGTGGHLRGYCPI